MERLDGFSFDDVEGMHAAGIDTEAVVRALMICFLEGATLFGVFHGDLHGGNLLRPGRRHAWPCSTTASPGAWTSRGGWPSCAC